MLDELGEHCRVGDVVSTFDAGGAALFAAPSGGAFAGGAVAFHFTAAVAAWLVLRHCSSNDILTLLAPTSGSNIPS